MADTRYTLPRRRQNPTEHADDTLGYGIYSLFYVDSPSPFVLPTYRNIHPIRLWNHRLQGMCHLIYRWFGSFLSFHQRRHSERIPYVDLLDFFGRFDSLKFEKWMRGVVLDAMTVPYGSVWVSPSIRPPRVLTNSQTLPEPLASHTFVTNAYPQLSNDLTYFASHYVQLSCRIFFQSRRTELW
jgi:hypothetical protein